MPNLACRTKLISRVELIRTRNQELRPLLRARNTRDGCGMNRTLKWKPEPVQGELSMP